MLVFDLNNYKSFKNLDNWLNEIKMNAPENVPILLVGNKSDLLSSVTMEEIKQFTEKNEIPYMITSAKNYKNTINCFTYLVDNINIKFMNEVNINVIKKSGVFNLEKANNNKRCCL